jgi:hypothetical protein
MTEQERQAVKAKLIEFGFRGADEPGDPTTDIHDAGALHDRIQAKLAKDVFLLPRMPPERLSWTREVVIFYGHQTYRLVTASNYIEAINLAALALPEVLRRHPECAADQR